VGRSRRSDGRVPKNVLLAVDQAFIRVLWDQCTAVLLEQGYSLSKVRCGIKDEHMTHISWCKDPGQDSMFKILVCEVHTWLVATLGKTTISSTVEEYLLGRG
jgi:hypothetical protein